MMRFTLLIGLLLGTAGCIKTTDSVSPARVSLSEATNLYVACFISPQDTVLSAKVVEAVPLTAAAPAPPVRNARVVLTDGPNSLTLTYNEAQGHYQARPVAPFAIRPGTRYKLLVTHPNGKQVQAETVVPASVPIGSVRIDSVVTNQGSGWSIRYQATLNWTSPVGLSYYRGFGWFEQEVTSAGGGLEMRISQPDFGVLRGNNPTPEPYTTTGSFTLTASAGSRIRTRRVTLGLFNTDANYYQYQASIQEQLATPVSLFVNRPGLFSNIEGGYGIFAAYNATYLVR